MKKRRGRKLPCKRQGCPNRQDSFSECALCAVHSANCICNYHSNRHAQAFKRKNLLLKAPKKKRKTASALQRSGFVWSPPQESFDAFETSGNEEDGDQLTYHSLLRGKVTMIGADTLCFPDIFFSTAATVTITDIRSSILDHFVLNTHCNDFQLCSLQRFSFRLSTTNFVHVYRVSRTFLEVTRIMYAVDCHCDYSAALLPLLSGGFDEDNQTFDQLLAFFKVPEKCVHARCASA